MKTHVGFISNSSSTSFIVLHDDSIIPSWVKRVELTLAQKKRLMKQCFIKNTKDKVYLTQFISDMSDDVYVQFYSGVNSTNGEAVLKDNIKEYRDGGHGWPYDEEDYNEIADNVWLLKGNKK
jgi:hypothetical protein